MDLGCQRRTLVMGRRYLLARRTFPYTALLPALMSPAIPGLSALHLATETLVTWQKPRFLAAPTLLVLSRNKNYTTCHSRKDNVPPSGGTEGNRRCDTSHCTCVVHKQVPMRTLSALVNANTSTGTLSHVSPQDGTFWSQGK